MPQLHFEEPGRAPFVYVLRPGRTVIGRSDRCDVALPTESVSRVHCMVEVSPNGVRLLDRSRHGTLLNQVPVDEAWLNDGDQIGVGTYQLRYIEEGDSLMRLPTATAPMPMAAHEQLMDGTEEGVVSERVSIRFEAGRRAGQRVVLTQSRVTVGGPGAQVEIDGQLPHDALVIRVARGRAMLEARNATAFLAGARVREITPVLPGEEVRLGESTFVLEPHTDEEPQELDTFGEMVGNAAVMRIMFGALSRMAGHDAPVLLIGESGTGKELAARGLHDNGASHSGPFVAVNCAAIAHDLFESELFGHEKGAFTGATERRDGAFHQASGGTLFLDEVGEMPLELQAKLLRALESGEVRRVGGDAATYPDARVVAATNRNLVEMVQAGRFREDLYWRLAVLTVRLPSLRERTEDLPLLARTLLARQHPEATLTADAEEAIQQHPWPGNVRELRNVLTRAYVMEGPTIRASSLSFNPWAFDEAPPPEVPLRPSENPERTRLREALRLNDGNRTKAAKMLGMPRSTLLYKLRKHGLMGK